MTIRDDFSDSVKEQIRFLSGYRCSNPDCREKVFYISPETNRKINLGVIAHICAASPGGPRYDYSMTGEERRGEGNGILLCAKCASLIDRDMDAYPVGLLRNWKRMAYANAKKEFVFLSTPDDLTRALSVIRELVRVFLSSYRTHGKVVPEARFRGYASMMFRLFFEDLPVEHDYDNKVMCCLRTLDMISFNVLENVSVRVSHFDRSFPRRYDLFMEELGTYSIDIQKNKGRILDVIEETTRCMFMSEEAFCMNKEENISHQS